MSNSDTPISDNAKLTEKNGCISTFQGQQVVPYHISARLERELADAKKERDEYRALWHASETYKMLLDSECRNKELKDLLYEADNFLSAYESMIHDNDVTKLRGEIIAATTIKCPACNGEGNFCDTKTGFCSWDGATE